MPPVQHHRQYHWKSRAVYYTDVIMGAIASQITSLTIVYSTVYSDADQRKHQSSASLAFVWGIDPHKWPVTRKMLPFDDVIMPNPTSCAVCCHGCGSSKPSRLGNPISGCCPSANHPRSCAGEEAPADLEPFNNLKLINPFQKRILFAIFDLCTINSCVMHRGVLVKRYFLSCVTKFFVVWQKVVSRWWSLLGLLSWCPIFQSSQWNSLRQFRHNFGYQIFKWVADLTKR